MTPNRGRIICHLTALLIGLFASGCYIPGGGWTMRTGIDLRRYKKPSAFVELVDTRWDEYNRVAEINSMTVPTAQPAAFTSGTAPGLMEGIGVPPASDPGMVPDSSRMSQPGGNSSPTSDPPEPGFPGNPTGGTPTGGEPNQLPGAVDAPASTPLPRDAPTARRSALDGPPMSASATDDLTTDLTVAAASAQSPAAKPSRRPMASRLFSRPQ